MTSKKERPDPRSLSPFAARPAGGRRKLLKSALLGSAAASYYLAPERWTRPIIESVTLPVHAQTTVGVLGDGPWAGPSGDLNVSNRRFRGRSLARRIADFVVSPARAGAAGFPGCSDIFRICIRRIGNDVEVQVGFDSETFDQRVVTPSNLQFNYTFDFGDFALDGEYDPVNDRWTGNVQGPCNDGGENLDIAWAAELNAPCGL